MGQEENINFSTYENIVERFDKEWRVLHEKPKTAQTLNHH